MDARHCATSEMVFNAVSLQCRTDLQQCCKRNVIQSGSKCDRLQGLLVSSPAGAQYHIPILILGSLMIFTHQTIDLH
jgi:hypothetical protein